MSNIINNGGPAFPCDSVQTMGGTIIRDGMTMRDYFAAKAMEAFITGRAMPVSVSTVAQSSYDMADAMLRARGEA